MKKKKIFKISSFILVFLVAMFSMFKITAYATDEPTDEDVVDDDKYASYFGVSGAFKETKDGTVNKNKVVITVGKKDDAAKTVTFKVVAINGQTATAAQQIEISTGSTNSKEIDAVLDSNGEMTITLMTTDKVTIGTGKNKKTSKVKASIKISVDENEAVRETKTVSSGTEADISLFGQKIDCSKYNFTNMSYEDITDSDSDELFKKKFCYVKSKADTTTYKEKGSKIKDLTAFEMKCSTQATKITIQYSDETKAEYDKQYYQNEKYYYASEVTTVNAGTYKYNYAPGTDTGTEAVTCKKTCEEVVIVQYGPPVASKAGLCFEYKVKVTSRVNCTATAPNMYKTKVNICTPAPTCYHGTTTYKQGGPSEEYDSCIKSCDDGKYTDKCSNKCYKQVYGATSGVAKQNDVSNYTKEQCYETEQATQGGCYYWSGNSIKWYDAGTKLGSYYTPGYWYFKYPNAHKRYEGNSYIVAQDDGFYRANYGTTYCHDNCVWGGCSKDEYLNENQAVEDAKKNKKIYEAAVAECNAQATCTTSTAEFTMSVKYTSTGTNKETTINFPYSQNDHKDTLSSVSCDDKSTSRSDTSKISDSTILDYAGCYKNCSNKNYYMTEISFPGTWVNKKTGEISYVPTTSKAWREKTNKFCLPRDAKDVNQTWYHWYNHKVEGAEVNDSCLTTDEKNHVNDTTYSGSISNWNINATAKNFGYFEWNFDISCFYAIDATCDCTGTSCDKTDSNTTEYRIRTVSNEDLFPSSSGSTSSTETTNREVGYNWTTQAKLSTGQVPTAYENDPEQVLSAIQKKSNTIYKDANTSSYSDSKDVDYYFRLTPSDLSAIKKYNKTLDSYNTFCGLVEEIDGDKELSIDDAGVTAYYSNLFSGKYSKDDSAKYGCSNVLTNVISAGKVGNPKCNNEENSTCKNANGGE